jgi:hypothetical protein
MLFIHTCTLKSIQNCQRGSKRCIQSHCTHRQPLPLASHSCSAESRQSQEVNAANANNYFMKITVFWDVQGDIPEDGGSQSL